jgi:phenylacetate-CoA ligase
LLSEFIFEEVPRGARPRRPRAAALHGQGGTARQLERFYRFGDHIACGEKQVVRLRRTSGTTGRPLQLANSGHDVALVARLGGRAMFAAGARPGDRVVHCLNYYLWTGGVTDHLALEAAVA